MASRCYLMSIEEFWEALEGKELFAAALGKVDAVRRGRAERMRSGRAQAACVGAGLLLQLALQEALAGNGKGTEDPEPVVHSVSRALGLVERPVELVMDYGENGKPYLREYPLFFNLSHSGKYVACAVSDSEIGADIQKCTDANATRIAERFFSEEENRALRTCNTEEERRRLFFRLWVRKEAYGKLLGKGIVGISSWNLLPDEEAGTGKQDLLWREWNLPEGYMLAVCQWTRKGLI